jgi:L-fuconolactonase
MLIVDAQVHIWGADTPERPWPSGSHGRAHRPQPFSKDDLLREMDGSVGVYRTEVAGPRAASRMRARGPRGHSG